MSANPAVLAHSAATSLSSYNPVGDDTKRPDWAALLDQALTQPGMLTDAYRQFHRYSAGNAFLVALQAQFRGLPLGPVASFKAWLNKGYTVKKGEKALSMVMPVTVTARSPKASDEDGTEPQEVQASGADGEKAKGGPKRTVFMFRRNWFLFAQVEPGENAQPLDEPKTPEWSFELAAQNLGVQILDFEMMDGNCQGFASSQGVALNPMARFPVKTAAHELAHVLLGHIGGQSIVDHEDLPHSKMEAEAESVAFIVAASLDQPEEALSSARAYVQRFLGAGASGEDLEEFKKKSTSRIFSVADKILRAGQAQPPKDEESSSDAS